MKNTKQNTEIKTALLERIYGAHIAPLLRRGWERLFFLLFLIIGLSTANAQVGIGTTTPDASSILDVTSTDKVLLLPRMNTAQRDAISNPATGGMVYNTDIPCLQINEGTPSAPLWICISGIAGLDPNTADADGDGVLDATDTDRADPCIPVQVAGYTGYNPANLTWQAADCDGDGYTNDEEVTCGSDPYDSGDDCGPCNGLPSTVTFNGLTYGFIESAGNCWLDRNLGASRVATSATDFLAYGDLYQWGRGNDGHQVINWTSATTSDGAEQSNESTSQSTSPTPGSTFITGFINWYDGTNPEDLWKSDLTGVNNPCPLGFRVPSQVELSSLASTFNPGNDVGAFSSPLKLISPHVFRSQSSGGLSVSSTTYYWSSTVSGVQSFTMRLSSGGIDSANIRVRGQGMFVRCVRD